ncbi:MAG TPA: tetratricopeptide repeat protein [Chloroflexota bacterium]
MTRDRGELQRAEECFERSLALSDRIGDQYTSAHTWHQSAAVARDRGDLRQAEERVQRGLALFERLGDEHGRAECWTSLGVLAGERGDLTISAWRCRAAHRLAKSLGLGQTDALATLGQAEARRRAGRLGAAAALLDHAQELAATSNLRLEVTQVALVRAELQLRGIAVGQGTLAAGEASAHEGLQLAAEGGYRREEALAHRLLGRCDIMRSRPRLRRTVERRDKSRMTWAPYWKPLARSWLSPMPSWPAQSKAAFRGCPGDCWPRHVRDFLQREPHGTWPRQSGWQPAGSYLAERTAWGDRPSGTSWIEPATLTHSTGKPEWQQLSLKIWAL